MKRIVLILPLALSACGTVAQNSDVGLVHTGLAGPVKIADNAVVEIVDGGPPLTDEKQRVMGTSCRNKLWDAPPSKENAIALMKRQAADRGYNAVHSVKVFSDPSALAKNCWSALIASGIAFSKEQP
ncbi:hypothetical protein [Ciceribacter ferrooxidans]|uniref:Lipoprotein n=1 Tax=Ciceribacter ferrooxidans TaxID=2509717 RepID=A0A4Q2T062_9HYPH|nr:hypothetical protein [Ciceribacter ferrooxidans]RYC10048.1 hypothetical protein EUU22_18400 [Ciceribacter ferrooxidans]